jgi:glycosyltransferase involved in cell wall biosynthesis
MACMMVSRSLFGEVGGFDTGPLAQAYGDVAFCLECRERGKRMVWTPHAVLLHEHSTPAKLAPAGNNPKAEPRIRHRASPAAEVMFGRWLTLTAHDPAYNRNLSLSRTAFEIETLAPLVRDPEQRFAPRVLAHPADRTGCGEYRVLAPMRRLNAAGRIEGFDTEQYYSIPELARLSPDTILFQRQVDWEQIAEMEAYLRFSRAFRIYELDDLLTNIQKKNSARGAYEAKDFIERFQKALSLCNRLVVSTEYLAEEYGRYAEDVKVVPNYLEAARWGHLSGRRATSAKPRVGWAGSVTHGGDLEIIIDVVKATRKDIDWVFLGMCPKDVQKLVKEFHPGVPLAAYPAKLASLNLDLAVAPLEDVPFNHGKSHLKILEYGILGYPVIATDITPYRGAFPITRVPNRFKDWVEAIREHVSDRDELARRGDALREHIRANWMLDDHLEVWLKAWLPS